MRKYLRHYGTFLIITAAILQPAVAAKTASMFSQNMTDSSSSDPNARFPVPTVLDPGSYSLPLKPGTFATQVITNNKQTQDRLAAVVAKILPPSTGKVTAQPVSSGFGSTTQTAQPTKVYNGGFGGGSDDNSSISQPPTSAPAQGSSLQLY